MQPLFVSSARFFVGGCEHLRLTRGPLARLTAFRAGFDAIELPFTHGWLRVVPCLVDARLTLLLRWHRNTRNQDNCREGTVRTSHRNRVLLLRRRIHRGSCRRHPSFR